MAIWREPRPDCLATAAVRGVLDRRPGRRLGAHTELGAGRAELPPPALPERSQAVEQQRIGVPGAVESACVAVVMETRYRTSLPAPRYHRRMGSSGMKRKGRKHLPKVGTRPANEYELQDRRDRALHPFSEDPWRRRRPGSAIAAIVVALVVLIGIVALVAAT